MLRLRLTQKIGIKSTTSEFMNSSRDQTSPNRITLHELADVTGVSIATVSRALRDLPAVHKETRASIRDAAQKLGYIPDQGGVRLRTGKTQSVGIVVHQEDPLYVFGYSLIQGMHEQLRNSGYTLIILSDEKGGRRSLDECLKSRMVDGLILTHTMKRDPRIRSVIEAGIPLVTYGRSDISGPYDWHDFDNETFAYQAVQTLAEAGCDKIIMPLPSRAYNFNEYMKKGYLRALREQGLKSYETNLKVDVDTNEFYSKAKDILTKKDSPNGWVCVRDHNILPLLSAVESQGKVIGSELQIAAKQANENLNFLNVPMVRFRQDLRQAGSRIIKSLLNRIRTPSSNSEGVLLDLPRIHLKKEAI